MEQLLLNTDVLYRGVKAEGYAELRNDIAPFRRYRLLATHTCFALQELYLSINLRYDQNREQTVRVFLGMFRHYLLSEADFPKALQLYLEPHFQEFMFESCRASDHVSAKMAVGKILPGGGEPAPK